MNNYLKLEQISVLLGEANSRIKDLQADLTEVAMPEPRGFVYSYPSKTADGRFMPVSWRETCCPEQRALSEEDMQSLAARFDVPYAHIKAVVDIESAGSGFLLSEPPPARPKILFEAHWFYKLTSKPISKIRPDLSSPRWDRGLYVGGSGEYDRLEAAMEFDELQALKSASWGLGQIMGFNYNLAGCDSIQQFVEEEFTSEKLQFTHMLCFIKNTGLIDELRAGNWRAFARGYNGAGYASNKYDTKLAKAAAKYE